MNILEFRDEKEGISREKGRKIIKEIGVEDKSGRGWLRK